MGVLGTQKLVLNLRIKVTSSVWNMRAKMDVLGMKKCSTPQWTKRRPTPTPEIVGDYSAGSFISGNFVTFIIRPFHSNTYEVLRYTLKSTWYQWLPLVPRLVIHSFINKEGVVQDRKKQVTPSSLRLHFLALYFLVTKNTSQKRNARVARHKSAPFRSAPLSSPSLSLAHAVVFAPSSSSSTWRASLPRRR